MGMALPREEAPAVLVRTLDGEGCELSPRQGRTVGDLRVEIEEQTHVPVDQQRLLHRTRVLREDDLDVAALRSLPGEAGMPLELTLLTRSPEAARWLRKVRRGSAALSLMPQEFRDDKDIVLEAVKHYPFALQHASEELRGDREVVLQAVGCWGGALAYAAPQLWGDKDIVVEAVRRHPSALQHASEELRGDREVVLQAVSRDGQALRHAAPITVGRDRESLLRALDYAGHHPSALQYAAPELQADREFVLRTVDLDLHGFALKYAAPELKADKEVVLRAVRRNGWMALMYAASELQADKQCQDEANRHR